MTKAHPKYAMSISSVPDFETSHTASVRNRNLNEHHLVWKCCLHIYPTFHLSPHIYHESRELLRVLAAGYREACESKSLKFVNPHVHAVYTRTLDQGSQGSSDSL
jgi:hypothetical protein